ncbi:MAG: small, acid-soluble spore protein, alpha/beta type [Defluviitaleaceae bacterium]|nr:small, acid-soluble spore protein, alpha/beta type [Defluviitaleaceae bacterium]
MDDRKRVEENNRTAREAANKFRYEAAAEIAPTLLTGYPGGSSLGGFGGMGGFSSGYLVRRMIEAQEKQMGNQGK